VSQATARVLRTDPRRVKTSEVLSALSYALDLTDGQEPGHTLRSCIIGMGIGEAIGLTPMARSALYYALLLKDAGCSSNASRMAVLFGADDRDVKRKLKEVDWTRRREVAGHLLPLVAAGSSLVERCWRVVRLVARPGAGREIIAIRCDRGGQIARRLGFPAQTSDAIRSLDEHWNGRGFPEGLRGEAIPLLARIAGLAQTVEVFCRRDGMDAALAIARARAGQWFDPHLVDVLAALTRDAHWVASIDSADIAIRVSRLEPPDRVLIIDNAGLDPIVEAFSEIIDAKSPYTYRHSTNVAAWAQRMGRLMGVGEVEARRLVRAGLLHDIGKLGVSNRILDKPGALSAEERRVVEFHPLHTAQILGRVGVFSELIETAARHHERLDRSGYPWKLGGSELDTAARILAVADVFEALTADRPYRAPMSAHAALAIMARDRGTRLCSNAFDALEASAGAATGPDDVATLRAELRPPRADGTT
jgi:putative nucleotidyltransferase with HDIG domain